MNIYVGGTTALQFWISSKAHRGFTFSRWRASRGLRFDGRTQNPSLPLNVRCIIQSELESNENGASSVFKDWGVSPRDYLPPLLGDLVDGGPLDLPTCKLPAGHIPELTRSEANGAAERFGLSLPLQLLVPCDKARRNSHVAQCHVADGRIPPAAFVFVEEGMHIARPEFALYSAACELASKESLSFSDGEIVARLAVLCSELFALYVSDPCNKFGLLRRQALCSPAKLEAFLSEIAYTRCRPLRLLRKALEIACGPCASPMEIAAGLLACAPRSMGGYGLGEAKFNCPVGKTDAEGSLSRLLLDLYFPKHRTALEYKGVLSHVASLDKDSIREARLAAEGIRVLSVTRAQLASSQEADKLMIDVLAKLFRRKDSTAYKKYETERRLFFKTIMAELVRAKNVSRYSTETALACEQATAENESRSWVCASRKNRP